MDVMYVILTVMISFPLSLILTTMFYPLYAGMRKIFYVPIVRNKLLRKAAAEGRTIIAHKAVQGVNCDKPMAGVPIHSYNMGENRGVYLFEYNGRTYKRIVTSIKDLPDTITLFYMKNPKKAQIGTAFGLAENPTWILQYLALVVIGAVIIYVVGYDYVREFFQSGM